MGVLENPWLKVAPSEDKYLANFGMNWREPKQKNKDENLTTFIKANIKRFYFSL